MHEGVDTLSGSVMSGEQALEREFEARLLESSTLAFRVAYGVLRHREDAEDVAQEAFAKAYQRFRQLRDRDRFRAWLVRMTWRLAIDRQRADRRRASRELSYTSVGPVNQESPESHDRAAQLWEAIDALPEKLRIVVVLAGIEGHDTRNVGLLLGLPQGTIKSRLFLARQRLREKLQWTVSERLAE